MASVALGAGKAVATASPSVSNAPRCAGRTSAPCRTVTGPDVSDTRHASTCAMAALLAVSMQAARAPAKILVIGISCRSGGGLLPNSGKGVSGRA